MSKGRVNGLVLCTAVSVALAACGGGTGAAHSTASVSTGSHQNQSFDSLGTSGPQPLEPPPSIRTTSTTRPGPSVPDGGTPPSTASTVPGEGTRPSVASTAPPTGSTVPRGANPPSAGTYSYRQSGSQTAEGQTQPVPAQGNLRIDPAQQQGSGAWTQTWHSYTDPAQPPNDTTYMFNSGGLAIMSTVTRSSFNGQTVSFTCTFAPPLQVTPMPPTIGYSFSGQASCGSFNAQARGRIDGTNTVALDGQMVTVFVIDSTITTSGSVSLTDHESVWFSPRLGLLVHTSDVENGTYGLFSFSSQITRDLESGHPR